MIEGFVFMILMLIQAPLIYGMLLADAEQFLTEKNGDELTGEVMAFAFMFALMPFVGVFLAFLLTGFAKKGMKWSLK